MRRLQRLTVYKWADLLVELHVGRRLTVEQSYTLDAVNDTR